MTYRTKNQGVAAALRYTLGPEAHRATFIEDRGITFLFDDMAGECATISRMYHHDDNGSGFTVADAKSLVDEFIAVRRTMSEAINSPDKKWKNQ